METKVVRLEEVCEIRRGSSPRPISDFISKSEGMPWVKISDATSTNSKVISETSEFIKFEGVDKSVIVQKGDLILSNSGTAGLPKFMGIEACIHDGWQVLRNLKGITSDYLYYSLIYIRSYLLHHAYDSVMKNLTLDMVRNAEVRLPPIPEQTAIAHILSTLDDKIELNRQTNETLEAMAQALFKSWFVDFDPVIDNALLAGQAIPEPLKERAELRQAQLDSGKAKANSEINDLFPSEFEFTEELGWIPKGWGVFTLANITTELRRGISPKYTEENGIRVVNQRCIRNHTIDYAVCRLNDPNLRKVENRLIEIGDVLVNSTGIGTLGRMAQVYDLEEDTVVDSHVTVVRSDDSKVEKYFFGRLMLSIEPIVESMGQGSTGQTELSRKHLGEMSVCLPSLKTQKFVEDVFLSYAEKVNFNLLQNVTLAKLRDTLLPKLMSGELRIADAEKLVADI